MAGDVSAAQGWGSTPAERAAGYPCDRHLPDPTNEWFRAIDVDAPTPATFRWLCQLKQAPYSYDWLDNLGRRSPRELTPGVERLEVGQKVMAYYDLVEFEPDHHLTIDFRLLNALAGKRVVTYAVAASGAGSRIVVKIRHKRPRGPLGAVNGFMLPRVDLIMMRKQLRNLKKLAEGS